MSLLFWLVGFPIGGAIGAYLTDIEVTASYLTVMGVVYFLGAVYHICKVNYE